MNIILASTSTVFGGGYLEYLQDHLIELYAGVQDILFIPFARPSGISHDEYTKNAALFFEKIGIKVRGLHEYTDQKSAIENAEGYFTGGGNTFLLVKTLHDAGLMQILAEEVKSGKPYLGTSAGSNIGGLNMKTTNDMPIVYPTSFETMGLVPFNINPHYLDPVSGLEHMGETRETRILEFLSQNDTKVVGLREGNWIRRVGDKIFVDGKHSTRIFEPGKDPYEVQPLYEFN